MKIILLLVAMVAILPGCVQSTCKLRCPYICWKTQGNHHCRFLCKPICRERTLELLNLRVRNAKVVPILSDFDTYDIDDNKLVDIQEFAAVFGQNQNGASLKVAFKKADTNGDGNLDETEFLNGPFVFEKDKVIQTDKRGDDTTNEEERKNADMVFKRVFINQTDTKGCKCSCSCGCETGGHYHKPYDNNNCESSPCFNGGSCTSSGEGYRCYCVEGYQGPNCETDNDNCESSPCFNGGSCTSSSDAYRCYCAEGYQGTNCETDVDECASNPCKNGGACYDMINGFSCICQNGYRGIYCELDWYPTDCEDILEGGVAQSGVYTIYPTSDDTSSIKVYCDQDIDGGGWLVFQRRKDGSVDFYRGWNDYVNGFGNLTGEFWLGLDALSSITRSKDYTLRIDLQSFENETKYAEYGTFAVGSAATLYKLNVGSYKGTAGDSLSGQTGHKFTTKDKDNDSYGKNCAVMYTGAWWYSACHSSNLNGKYLKENPTPYAIGVVWQAWKGYHYSMKVSEMKIRPTRK